MEDVLVVVLPAVITGVLTLAGVLVANNKNQAVTDTKLEELTREVREHNNFAQKIPAIETKLEHLESAVKELWEYHK